MVWVLCFVALVSIKVNDGCGGVSVCRIIGVGVYVIVSFAATGPGL